MSEYQIPITQDQVPNLLDRVRIMEKKIKYNKLILNLAGFLFAVLFSIMVISLTSLDPDIELQWLKPMISFMHASFILRPDTGEFLRVLMCIGFMLIPPIVVSLILKIFCLVALSVKKNNTDCENDGDIFDLQKKTTILSKSCASYGADLLAKWSLIYSACIFAFFLWLAFYFPKLLLPNESLFACFFVSVFDAVICFFLFMFVLLPILFSIVPHFRFNESSTAFFRAVDTACEEEQKKKKALEEEEQKRKEEEQKRREEELKRREEERKAKEKAERLQKGRELYEQATAGEVIDEEIMQKAADLCDPNASLYVGVKMVSNIEGYTTSEIKDIYKRAKRYLRVASDANLPDGVFLYCNTVMMTESLQYSEAYDLLKSLRSVKKNELSEGLCEIYSSSLQTLVNLVNDLEPTVFDSDVMRRSSDSSSYSSSGYSSSYNKPKEERTFTQGGSTGCGIGGSFCGCGAGR